MIFLKKRFLTFAKLLPLVFLVWCSHTSFAQVCNLSSLPTNLRNGLVAYYPFCGNANDVSGNGNNGTVNGATLTTDRFGMSNSAYLFNGQTDYIRVPHSAALNLVGDFSISCWFISQDPPGFNTNHTLLAKRDDNGVCCSSNVPWHMAINYQQNGVDFKKPVLANAVSGNYTFNQSNVTIVENNWQHLVFVYNQQVIKIYINGAEVYTSVLPSSSRGINTSDMLMGTPRRENIIEYLKGKLDDILIYNRPLSCSEVSQIYNAAQNSFPALVPFSINSLSDTTRVCGTSTTLNAGSGYSTYSWNTGATTQTISPTTSGFYKVSVTNTAGCTASDSTYLSLVNANIINNDTTICLGRSIKLSIDSIFPNRTACLAAQLPATMRDGLIAYYPFCGNANNALGTGNNGTVYNATLTTDRFGNSNSAYNFNGTNAYIDFGANPAIGPTTTIPISISLWINEGASGNVISKYTNLDASRSYFFFGRSSTEYSWVGNGTNPYIRNTTTPDNAWTHYVVIGVAGSNNSRVYRNGVLIATGTLAMNSTMQAISLLIGRLGGSFPGYLNGKVDDVFIFNRALSLSEIQSLYLYQPTIVWSNGATANSITVSPTQATTYYVDISDGINTCRDSVLVSVSDLTGFSPLSDTTRICGISATLNAGTGTYTYVWNTGATSQSITPTAGGFYKVTVTNQFGCTASDSTVLSLVNANILNRDTTICRGSSITLRIDSVFSGRAACNINGLPGNLRSGLLAYYPFCGSANDMSGNGNHGSVAAATLTADRFNVASCAYTFNGTNAQIKVNNAFFDNGLNSYTLSCWFKADRFLGTTGPGQVILNTSPHGGFALCYSRSTSQRRLSHWKSSNITTGWNIFADDLFSLNPANINLWYHVAIVKNGLNYQYYINGALDKSLTSSLATTPYLCSLIIGSIDGAEYFKGAIDDVFIYNRALSANEINLLFTASPSVSWSTGATSNSITVTPTQTTTYYVTVSDGVTSCIDSVHVTVSDIGTFDPLPDTTRICGTSTTLNAGTGTYTYAWNTGATSQSITPSAGGFYKVTVTNQFGCTASDSTVLSLVNANILNRDTTICRGSSVTLRIDSLFPGISAIDYDGNIYETVKIGNQNWIKSNLRTTRFSNGDLISNLSDISQWGTYSLPAWSYYSNNSLYNSVYGKLYNWYVASDTRNACPSGWRVSTDADWNILTKYLDLLADTSCVNCAASTTAAGHLKSIGISIWDSPNLGATNSSGFTSLPSGAIVSPGTFQYLGYSANYWTSSLFGVDNALFRNNVSVNASIWRGQEPGNIRNGLSIRCVKNENTSNISAIWSTGATSNSITVSPTQSTTYYVDVSDGITTCRDSIRINIADVDTSVVLLDPAQVCSNGGQVRMQAGFASSYQWLRNGTAISGATSRLYTATQSGIYRVALVNATGCVDTSRSITVTLNAQPVVGFNTASTTQCFSGNQFVFTNSSTISSGTLSYLWSFGNGATATQTNPSYSYPAAGTYQVKVVATSSNGCKDSTTRTVTVNASPTTVFTVNSANQCLTGNSFVFTNNSTIASGTLTHLWSFGNGSTSTAASPTFSYAAAGTYTVKLVVTGSSGCKDSTTRTVTVFAKPQVGFTINSATQCLNGNSFVFTNNSALSTGTLSYQWSFGDGSGASTTNATYNYITPGIYNVKLVALSNSGCADSTTQTVTVNPKPTVNFSVNTASQCLNANQFLFTNQSSISSGTLTHRWDFGDGGISTSASPSYTYNLAGVYTVKLVVTSSSGCKDSTTRSVTVFAKPQVGFTVNNAAQCINGNSFVFANTTSITSGTVNYAWTFGDGNGANTISATYSYATPGTHTVKLVAISNNGCADSVSQTVTVHPKPTVSFAINAPNQCLTGNQYVFTNQSSISSGTLTHRWTFGDGNSSIQTSPTYSYATIGSYDVKLVSTSALGCRDSLIRSVVVYPMPTGTLATPATNLLCEGGNIQLSATGGATYQWFLNGAAIAGATNATHLATQPGVYTVNLISLNGCTAQAAGTVTLQLIQRPTANFSYEKYCAGFPTQFNDLSNVINSGLVNYSWTFGAGLGSSTLQNPVFTFPTAGVFNVSLLVTPVACPSLTATVTKPVTTVTPPANQRYLSLNAIENRDLQLEVRNFGGAMYSWSPTTGLSSATIYNPVFNHNAEVDYLITITTGIGCVIKDSLLVRIFKEKEIFVPKGFSPNGDGNNDKIFPRLVGVRTLTYFKVYNRWGQLIFQTSNINEGWDGTYRGSKQPMETYVWMAEGIDIDNNAIKRTGTFLLLR